MALDGAVALVDVLDEGRLVLGHEPVAAGDGVEVAVAALEAQNGMWM